MEALHKIEKKYEDGPIRLFTLASLFWVIIGLAFGVFIAAQMAYPHLNFNLPWTTFGRLRPCHTTGVIFGFAGNVLFATSLFVVQRTCQTKLPNVNMAYFVFWAYQLSLILAISGYVVGITQSKEYAEPEWYVDILITVLWVVYGILFMWTLINRKEQHIYVANWFYIAFILVVAMLHIGNNISIPLAWNSPKSVSVFSGVQSAMIQWWYGHNMVGFFLTTGFLGVMYYFIPKRANRPIYSYRLSILHFWGLVFLYIWVGSHHLIYTSLPDWTQTLGMTMSLMLWLPSWGGSINGIMTLSGSWYKLREDPVLQFLIIAVAFYGMSTFEGPMLAIKSVNALAHYTDWIISHVHSGALGWVALISFGALYHLVPILWDKPTMYSVRLISLHLWLASIGIVLYVTSMWAAGITEGLMLRSYNELGFLMYSFIQVVAALHHYYVIRMMGGASFLLGAIIMVYNCIMTIRSKPQSISEEEAKAYASIVGAGAIAEGAA